MLRILFAHNFLNFIQDFILKYDIKVSNAEQNIGVSSTRARAAAGALGAPVTLVRGRPGRAPQRVAPDSSDGPARSPSHISPSGLVARPASTPSGLQPKDEADGHCFKAEHVPTPQRFLLTGTGGSTCPPLPCLPITFLSLTATNTAQVWVSTVT